MQTSPSRTRLRHPLRALAATVLAAGLAGIQPPAGAHGLALKAGEPSGRLRALVQSGAASPLRLLPAESAAGLHDCSICGTIESIAVSRTAAENAPHAEMIAGRLFAQGQPDVSAAAVVRGAETLPGPAAGQAPVRPMHYVVKVRMADGTFRIVTQGAKPEYVVGDRVRVVGGTTILT